MAKYYGVIGYINTEEVETSPGVWQPTVTEREYYGDLVRNFQRHETGQEMNDDLTISNEISIVADPYALNNFHAIRYAEFMGSKWKVNSVDVQYPRLVLSLGGVYNEQTTSD